MFGNVLLGPTAEDVADRADRSTSAAGLSALLADGRRILPGLEREEVTATYAGLRAATEHSDYQLGAFGRYVRVAGIRSTGLTASLGIAEHVAGLLGEAGLPLKPRPSASRGGGQPPPRMPYLGEAGTRPYQDAARIAADPAYGEIACHCERVSRGEIRDALASDIPPGGLDGLRRRTRAMNGRCQAFWCGAAVSALFGAGRGPPPGGERAMDADVLVVGAGPAGLAAAAELRRLGVRARRGRRPGGGARRHPAAQQAHRLRPARPAPGAVRPGLRAGPDGRGGPRGRASCAPGAPSPVCGPAATAPSADADQRRGHRGGAARAVLLATGCRERPRAARLVPGDRPSGVLTTGELQQRVYLAGERLAGRALIVGAEHVSFSAAVTLAHAGARVLALVTDQPRHQSYAAFRLGAALRWRVPVWTSTAVTRVTGANGRLAAVEVSGVDGGPSRADRLRLARLHRRLDSRPRARADRLPDPG